ncbi:glycosyltransferase [Actinomycetota bacterium]
MTEQREDGVDVEYVVVDPGSTDDSGHVIERHASRIDKVIRGADSGPADGLNRGFQASTGEILGFINADDYLEPHALATIVRFFCDNPDVDVVTGGLVVHQQGSLIRHRVVLPPPLTLERWAHGHVAILQQSTFFRRRAWVATPGFNEANASNWDAELFLEMLASGASFGTIHNVLAHFRIYGDSITGSGRLEADHARRSRQLRQRAAAAVELEKRPRWLALATTSAWRARPRIRAKELALTLTLPLRARNSPRR